MFFLNTLHQIVEVLDIYMLYHFAIHFFCPGALKNIYECNQNGKGIFGVQSPQFKRLGYQIDPV